MNSIRPLFNRQTAAMASSPKENRTLQARAAKGGFVSGVNFAINLGLNLVQVPLLLHYWPQETYGLWLGVGALSTLLTSLDGGHQAYVGNLLSRHYVEDRVLFQRTLASAVRIAAGTSVIQIGLALALCFSGKAAAWLGIEPRSSADFSLAVAIYTVGWIATGSVGSILVRLFPPTGLFVRSVWWATVARIVQFGAVVVAARLGWGLVGTALLFTGLVFTANVLLLVDICRLYPHLFPWWRGGNFRRGLRNFVRSNVLTGVSILDLLSLQGVVLLITGSLGAAAVPLFTTLRTLANTAMQGTGFLLNPIQPDLVRYHVQREGEKIGAVFRFFWLTTGAVINGGVVAGLFFVEPVYALWTRGKLGFDRVLFGWLVAAVLVRTLSAPLQSYLIAINHLKAQGTASVVRAVVTGVGVVWLAPRLGLAGVAAVLFVAEFCGSLILPWWFTRQSLAELGGNEGGFTDQLAVISAMAAGLALLGFGMNARIWPWLAGGIFVAIIGLVLAQWRGLSPEVKGRALTVFQPIRSAWRSMWKSA